MPPINQQGSRAALVTTLVVFVILFVTSTIVAIHFYGQAKLFDQYNGQLKELYAPIVSANSVNGPVVTAFNETRRDQPQRFNITDTDTTVDVAAKQVARLATAITGKNDTLPNAALDAADKAVQAAQAKLAAVKIPTALPTTTGLTSDVDALSTMVYNATQALTRIGIENQVLKATIAKAAADTAALTKQRDTVDQGIRAAAAAQLAQVQKSADDSNAKVSDIEKNVAAAGDQNKQQVDKALADIAAANGKIADLEKQRGAAVAARALFRLPTENAVVQQVDGHIIRVPGGGVCYIDLGLGDHVPKGLTFEVYGKDEGIPKIPATATGDEQLPVGKASVEVVNVGATSSECRIVKTAPGAVLAEGDLLANLVYDRNTKYKFFVYGNFDLAHTGRANPADAEVIKRLVTQWGGELTDKVNVDTDFVVLGAEPTLPDFNKADMTPEEAAKLQAAQEALDKYQDLRTQATRSSVPVLNQNRFLYYVGYYDQARR